MTLKGAFHFYMLTNVCWIGWLFGKFTRVTFRLAVYHQAILFPFNFSKWHQHPLVGCEWITGFTCLWVYLVYRMWADCQINLSYCVYSTFKSTSLPLFLHHRHLPFIYNIVHVLTCKMQKVTQLKHRHQNMTPK